jgi:hypothetical protein
MNPEDEEGWFTDPFGLHEARWLSRGVPTKLVRDGDVEAYDEPPDEPPAHEPQRLAEHVDAAGGADLLRAGEPGQLNDLDSLRAAESDGALEGGAHPQVELP